MKEGDDMARAARKRTLAGRVTEMFGWFSKSDHPRAIDGVIDYFGEPCLVPVREVCNPRLLVRARYRAARRA